MKERRLPQLRVAVNNKGEVLQVNSKQYPGHWRSSRNCDPAINFMEFKQNIPSRGPGRYAIANGNSTGRYRTYDVYSDNLIKLENQLTKEENIFRSFTTGAMNQGVGKAERRHQNRSIHPISRNRTIR